MADLTEVSRGWDNFKKGIQWSNPNWVNAKAAGKSTKGICAGYADANPGEAKQLDDFAKAVVSGSEATMPILQSNTGSGLALMFEGIRSSLAPRQAKITYSEIT